MTRILAVDFGEKRIGLATSTPPAGLATPRRTLRRKSDAGAAGEIARFCREEEIATVLVGSPAPPRAGRARSRPRIRSFAAKLATRDASCRCVFHEETLTSDEAARRLRGRRSREGVDAEAAAVLLEDWLAHRGGPRERSRAGSLRLGRCSSCSLAVAAVAAFLRYRLEHPPAPAGLRRGRSSSPARHADLRDLPPARPAGRRRGRAGWRRSTTGCTGAGRRCRRASTGSTAPMPIDEVIDRMGRGDVVRHAIVVPEGLTAEETFELFWSRGSAGPSLPGGARPDRARSGSDARRSDLEGFLFPDTYVVTRSTSARADRRAHGRELPQALHAGAPAPRRGARADAAAGGHARLDRPEGERRRSREGPSIAGVYLNRLRRGMRLQADPTVIYALKRDGKWTGTLYRSDYGYDSPYNTYLHEGLPPGPIATPERTRSGRPSPRREPTISTSSPTDDRRPQFSRRSRSTWTRSRWRGARAPRRRSRSGRRCRSRRLRR